MAEDDDDRRCLNELTRSRQLVDFRNGAGKREFLEQLYRLIENWQGQLPDLRHIFQEAEIDQILLWDYEDNQYFRRSVPFVQFAVRSGYRDAPRLDDNGAPLLNRCTALHRLAARSDYCSSWALFAIYDRYDVNYRDRSGFTHFHAACKLGFHRQVREFLELGRVDPDLAVAATGDRSLHLAIRHERRLVFEELLLAGADPNQRDARGRTALHLACRKQDEGAWARLVLDRARDRPLNVGALDRQGRSALRWAVTNLLPDVIQAMLDRGLYLFRRFPTPGSFRERLAASADRFAARLAAAALGVVEIFEAHGFARIPAMHVTSAFVERGWLDKSSAQSAAATAWHAGDEAFAEAASEIRIDSNYSLYDLIQLAPEEAAKAPVRWQDYFEFACSSRLWQLAERHWEPCSLHLCEIILRRLCRRAVLVHFCRLMRYALPVRVCEAILDSMSALDLYQVGVVSTWPII